MAQEQDLFDENGLPAFGERPMWLIGDALPREYKRPRKKRPKEGTKNEEVWNLIAEQSPVSLRGEMSGEEWAESRYRGFCNYNAARARAARKRGRKVRPGDFKGASEWMAAKTYGRGKSKRNPYDKTNCVWCFRERFNFERDKGNSKDNDYCPQDYCGPVRCGKGLTSKCAYDHQRSRNEKFPMSTIGMVAKIISQDYKCVGCRHRLRPTDYAQDHIDPKNNGGSNCYTNAQALCQSCNASKGTRPMGEWMNDHYVAGRWDCFEGIDESTAIRNLLLYCKHKRLRERCEAIIAGTIKPHKEEKDMAPIVLDWICTHEAP